MPIHMTPLTRRQFVSTSLAAGAGLLTLRSAPGAEAGAAKVDPDGFALLSDTHIPAKASVAARGINMSANLKKIADQLVGMKTRPAGALVCGDCAFQTGQTADYTNLAGLLAPLGQAELPMHLALGNHDNRERMYAQFKAFAAKARPVKSKHVSLVESPRANWFILDSLSETNVITGIIGPAQLAWLATALDGRKDKPAILVAHHPLLAGKPKDKHVNGVKDTEPLLEILARRPHVKAYVHGHTHTWALSQRNGLHVVSLPPTSYVFGRGRPNGWVHAQLDDGGVTLRPHCHDPKHAVHDKEFKLTWRPDKA